MAASGTLATPDTKPLLEAALWCMLFAGMSPVWLDLGRHLAEEPVKFYVLFFVLAMPVLAMTQGRSAAPRAGALWCVAAVVLFSVGAIGADLPRFARPCIPLAIASMALWRGWPSLPVALVSIWWVPVPSFVVKMLVRLASSQVYGVTPSEPIETGLPIAAVLSGLVYIVALVRGLTLLRALGLAAVGGLIGLLLQVSLVVAGL